MPIDGPLITDFSDDRLLRLGLPPLDPELRAVAEMALHVRVQPQHRLDVVHVLLEADGFDRTDGDALELHFGVARLAIRRRWETRR